MKIKQISASQFARFIILLLAASFASSASARPRPPVIPFPEDHLGFWRFDFDDWWHSPYPFPLALENLATVESWSGSALQMRGPDRAILQYPILDDSGEPLLTCDTGSIRFWFAPDWTSGDPASNTADTLGRLIEAGLWTKDASAGWWSLYFNPDHTALYFSANAGGAGADFLKAPIAWHAGEWHLLTLTYSPKHTALYLDGQLAAQGEGVSIVPGDDELLKYGFTIGGDHDGGNLASGWFDDIATFDHPLTVNEIAYYKGAVAQFTRVTPVDLTGKKANTAPVAFNPSFLATLEAPGKIDPEEIDPQSQLRSPQGQNGPMNLQGSNCLWLEIALTPTNLALLTLHGTTPGTNYLILSCTNLATSNNWVVETWMFGTNDQDWIETLVPLDRPAAFFRAGLGEDTDGDGLPDVYELLVTGTDPNNPDTGNTGTSDGYKDSDGDGWTNLDEMRNGTNPNLWNAPIAPFNLTAILTMSASMTNVTLTWEPPAGSVLDYELQKIDEVGAVSTLQISVNQSNYVDNTPTDYDWSLWNNNWGWGVPWYSTYYVRARFAQGWSQWSSAAPVLSQHTAFNATIVRGPQGAIYLAVSAVPGGVEALRLITAANDSPDPFDPGLHVFEIPVTNIVNGIYRFPDEESSFFASWHYWGFGVLGECVLPGRKMTYGFEVYQAYAQNYPGNDAQPRGFIDGSQHLKENIQFLLRAATATASFAYDSYVYTDSWGDFAPSRRLLGSTDYEYAGFRIFWHPQTTGWPDLNPFYPWQENTMLRNFVLNNSDTNASGSWVTGVDAYHWVSNPRHLLNPWDSNSFPSPFPTRMAAGTWQWSYYTDVGFTDSETEIGLTVADTGPGSARTYSLASDARNLFGLQVDSVKLGRGKPPQFPVLAAGGSLTTNGVFGLFPEVEAPALETVGYYFGVQNFYPGFPFDASPDPLPGHASFSVTNQTQAIIASVGHSIEISGWARQRIVNGDTNKFAYREEYFDKAYLLDASNNVVHQTGILSEYGGFFPTEPGRVILTTKPDPDQGGIQGTCLVHVISINLDVNHDGNMDLTYTGPDNTSGQQPFTFWANNDCDWSASPGSPAFDPGFDKELTLRYSDEFLKDYLEWLPRSIRDLEDWARLWICGVPALTNGNYSVTLNWANVSGSPAINLIRSADTNGGMLYLTDTNIHSLNGTAWKQVSSGYGFKTRVPTAGTVTLPISWFTNGANKYLLFEGAGTGKGELVVTISKNATNIVAQTSAWLDLHDVKDFYERAVITNTTSGAISNWTSGVQTVQYATESALGDDQDIIVLVHGINVSDTAWRIESDTVLKRLYHSGFHGRFATVKWPCEFFKLWTLLSLDTQVFNRSEIKAYKAGSALKTYLDGLHARFPGYRVHLMVHSQGNSVASEAIEQGATFDTYVLTQAALPASSYDVNAPYHTGLSNAEAIYGPTPEWRLMGYRGIYTNMTGRIVNFYNPKDPVLDVWISDQGAAKPNLPSTDYHYNGTNVTYEPPFGSSYTVTDPQESRAYASRSRTLPIGQSGPESSHGVLQSGVNLNTRYGFNDSFPDDHSAQWAWPIQTTRPYFQELLRKCQLEPAP